MEKKNGNHQLQSIYGKIKCPTMDGIQRASLINARIANEQKNIAISAQAQVATLAAAVSIASDVAVTTMALTQENPIATLKTISETGDTNSQASQSDGSKIHKPRTSYSLVELMQYEGASFIDAAYAAILERLPDEFGKNNYLAELNCGVSRIEVLGRLRFSTEGKSTKRHIRGLYVPYRLMQLSRVPFVGILGEILCAANFSFIADITSHEGTEFVQVSYRAVLSREPDTNGAAVCIKQLDSGIASIELLVNLHNSIEARSVARKVPGLSTVAALWWVARLPVIKQISSVLAIPVKLNSLLIGKRKAERLVVNFSKTTFEEFGRLTARMVLVEKALRSHAEQNQEKIIQQFFAAEAVNIQHAKNLTEHVLESAKGTRSITDEYVSELKCLIALEQANLVTRIQDEINTLREAVKRQNDLVASMQANLTTANDAACMMISTTREIIQETLLQNRLNSNVADKELKALIVAEILNLQLDISGQISEMQKVFLYKVQRELAQVKQNALEIGEGLTIELILAIKETQAKFAIGHQSLDQALLNARTLTLQHNLELKTLLPNELDRIGLHLKAQTASMQSELWMALHKVHSNAEQAHSALMKLIPDEIGHQRTQFAAYVSTLESSLIESLRTTKLQITDVSHEIRQLLPAEMSRLETKLALQVTEMSTLVRESVFDAQLQIEQESREVKTLLPLEIQRLCFKVEAYVSAFHQQMQNTISLFEQDRHELKAMLLAELIRVESFVKIEATTQRLAIESAIGQMLEALLAENRQLNVTFPIEIQKAQTSLADNIHQIDLAIVSSRSEIQVQFEQLRSHYLIPADMKLDELVRDESLVKLEASAQLLAIKDAIGQMSEALLAENRQMKVTFPIELQKTQTSLAEDIRQIDSAILNSRSQIQTQFEQLRSQYLTPTDMKLGRIEQYSMAAARRVALTIDAETSMVRTEVGYMMCPSRDTALLSLLVETGEVELGSRLLIQRLLKPGDVFIDVGANIGMHTVAAARALQGKGKVIAFEPYEAVMRCLQKSVWMNGVSDVVEYQCTALSNSVGQTNLYLAGTTGHNTIYPNTTSSDKKILEQAFVSVPVTTLDKATEKHPFANLIKIDAEGAELAIMEGGISLLNLNPHIALIVEFGPEHISRSGKALHEWMLQVRSIGFDFRVINNDTGVLELWSFDRLSEVTTANLFLARPKQKIWELAGVAS